LLATKKEKDEAKRKTQEENEEEQIKRDSGS
jgi:hypothetical protein